MPGRAIRGESRATVAGMEAMVRIRQRHAGTREVFGRDLRAAVPTVRRVKARSEDGRIPTYVGIALRTPDQGGGPADLGPPGYDHRHGPGGPRADSYVGPAEELDSDGAGDVER